MWSQSHFVSGTTNKIKIKIFWLPDRNCMILPHVHNIIITYKQGYNIEVRLKKAYHPQVVCRWASNLSGLPMPNLFTTYTADPPLFATSRTVTYFFSRARAQSSRMNVTPDATNGKRSSPPLSLSLFLSLSHLTPFSINIESLE